MNPEECPPDKEHKFIPLALGIQRKQKTIKLPSDKCQAEKNELPSNFIKAK